MCNSILRTVCLLAVCGIMPGSATGVPEDFQSSDRPSFVRSFSSADDVRRQHPTLDRTLDIIAGPKAPEPRLDVLQWPIAVTSDSNHRVLVADSRAVHIFDFKHAKYSVLDGGREHLSKPVSLAVDGHDNIYVVDEGSRTVLVYDSAGKFRRSFGKLTGGESYFESPDGIAIDTSTGRIYLCDTRRHMIIMMDENGRILGRVGRRGGGDRPGEFRLPTQAVVSAGELFVLDAGNTRLQIFDSAGHFKQSIALVDAGPRTGLAVDNQENIYVSYPSLGRIQVFNHSGQPMYLLDANNMKRADFSQPSALWVGSGYCFYVVDSGNNRVGQFQISGSDPSDCR